jgi:hypothetical protein
VKKYLAIILGTVFVLGFAASAFAIHAEIPAETQATVAKGSTQITLGGEIRMRGEIQQNTTDFNSDRADGKAYYDGRVRLYLDAKVTPNVQGFVQIEAGNGIEGKSSDLWIWGNGNGAAFTTTPNNNASGAYTAGDSKRGALNILEAWILYKGSGLLGIPAGLKVGHMPLALGNKLFFDHTKFGDDAIVIFADPTKELHVGVLTAKFREGNYASNSSPFSGATASQNDDANGYVALFNYRAKDFGFSGDATYVDDQTGAGAVGTLPFGGFAKVPIHFWNFGLRGDANFSGLGIMGDVEVQAGKIDNVDVKFRGWAGMAGLNYTLAPVKLVLEGAIGSGDSKADNKFSAFVTSVSYAQHYTYVYDYRTVNACAESAAGGLCNTWYIKAGAEANLTKDLSGLLNVYYLQAVKSEYGVAGLGGVDTTSKHIGTEVDAKLTYKIDRNLNYWVEGGYLFAGKFWESVPATSGLHDNAYAVRHGISLSF